MGARRVLRGGVFKIVDMADGERISVRQIFGKFGEAEGQPAV